MLGLWFVIRNCISVQITKCIFQKPFSARTPRKPCLCHGSPCSVAGCVTFAKSSLLEILLFCCYKKPASSMAWATFRRFFFFTVVYLLVAVHTQNLGFHVQVWNIITSRDHAAVCISHIAIFVFIYQLSSSPQ